MKKAFTIIELMIVVAIIAVLAMVSVPTFGKFLAKAKRSEAYMNLSSLYAAEKAYYAEHGKYSNVLTGPGSIGWKPEGKHYYTYGFQGSAGTNYIPGKRGEARVDLKGSKVDTSGFVACASCDLMGKGKPDIIAIDHNNEIKVVSDGLED